MVAKVILSCALSAVTALVLSSCSSTTPADPNNPHVVSFSKIDKNNDGKADRSDRMTRAKELFSLMDKNNDGKVSKDEYIAYRESVFSGCDKDGNAIIAVEELIVVPKDTDMKKMNADKAKIIKEKGSIDKMDINGDGVVTQDEYVIFFSSMVDKMDKNKDGKVTKDEYLNYHSETFGRIDRSKDGTITQEELYIDWSLAPAKMPAPTAQKKSASKVTKSAGSTSAPAVPKVKPAAVQKSN